MTPLALTTSERHAPPVPMFYGESFDVAEVWELSHQGGVRAAALAMYAAPFPWVHHTLNSGRDFMSERVSQLGQSVPSAVLKAFSRVEGIKARVAVDPLIPDWISRLHSVKSEEVEEITQTLSMILERLDSSGHDVMSRDLDMVDVRMAHPYHLLAALRTLFQQRRLIGGWKALERRTRDEFEKRELNPSLVMKGLNVDDKVRADR